MVETLRTRNRRLTGLLRRAGRTPKIPRPKATRPVWELSYREEPPPDDLDGGAGVREPRRPAPTRPTGAMELAEPTPQRLDLTR